MPSVLASRDSIYVAKTVFVDAERGYDALGAREDATKPFQTIAAGAAAMLNGDTLLVRKNTYNETVTIPNLASVRIVLEPGTVVTNASATATFLRSSSTPLTSLIIEGDGTIINTVGGTISVVGTAVVPAGYGAVEVRGVTLNPAAGEAGIYGRCLASLFVEDVRINGTRAGNAREVVATTLRNLDAARTGTWEDRFDAAQTPPDGTTAGVSYHYSLKAGAVSLVGALTAKFDASCELSELTSARTEGDLSSGMMLVIGDLTISDTGTATRDDLNAIVGGDATIDAATDFNGTIRGDLYLTDADVTVRGDIVGTVNEGGAGIGTIYATSKTEERLANIESGTTLVPGVGWTEMTGYTAVPASATTITMATDYTSTIVPGMALRWESSAGGYRWSVVAAVAANLITIRQGIPLNGVGGAETIVGLWYGDKWRVEPILANLPGSYAEADSVTALKDYAKVKYPWLKAQSSIAWYAITPLTVNAGAKPKVNMLVNGALASTDNANAGPAVTAADTQVVAAQLLYSNCEIEQGEYLEFKVTQTAASADDADLTIEGQGVIH